MNYIDAAFAPLRKTGQIKLYGPDAFAGMRKAGQLVAECLDQLCDLVKPGLPTEATEPSPSSTAHAAPIEFVSTVSIFAPGRLRSSHGRLEAIEPVRLKVALSPSELQLALSGGRKDALLEIDSFKVWAAEPKP